MRLLALTLALVTLAACDAGWTMCPAVSLPAVVVRVTDASTGEPLAEGAVSVARDGTFADTLVRYEPDGSLAGAFGRAGVYNVTVERAGYRPWERSGVVVRSSGGACPQPVTAVLEARLERASP